MVFADYTVSVVSPSAETGRRIASKLEDAVRGAWIECSKAEVPQNIRHQEGGKISTADMEPKTIHLFHVPDRYLD